MLDWINALACLVLLVLMAPIAKTFNHSRYWAQRIAFAVFVVVLVLEVAAALYDGWLPKANYLQTLFNLISVAIAIKARHQIMNVVRRSVGTEVASTGYPLTRAADRAKDIPESQLANVRGRGTGPT